VIAAAGCGEDKPATALAPTASALGSAQPAAAGAKKLVVDKASSRVDFTMEAPIEKIRGKLAGALEGELAVDPSDLTKTTGKLVVDISGLELFQRKKDDKGEFGEEKKEETQNKHARDWLQIGDDAPAKEKAEFSRSEFLLTKVESASEKDLTKMTGAERKVTMTVTGDFLLHGRKSAKSVELEAVFKFEGDKLASVAVKTTKPFAAGLVEHDVHPRKAFGILAEKGLEALGEKVAKEALVTVELTAKP
jgi:polyisoprenoid-binding protein YceI